jgi:hypothetical protein
MNTQRAGVENKVIGYTEAKKESARKLMLAALDELCECEYGKIEVNMNRFQNQIMVVKTVPERAEG